MATTRLSRTFSQTATSTKKGTFSCWFKRGTLGGEHDIIASPNGGDGGGNRSFIRIDDNNQIDFRINNSTNTNVPSMLFRDTNAWYHIVLAVDLTQSGGGDRLKFYVNGNLITSYSSQNYPSGSLNLSWGQNNVVTDIGYDTTDGGAGYFDGSMSHIHWTDGYTYTASAFGETDATTGEWKIKTSPSVTYGTNGFFILKDGNSVTDSSPNSNNFTVGAGTLTKTEDCPSNVFATMNPLDNQNQGSTFTNGNNKIEWNTDNKNNFTTLAMNAGKYYWEMKYVITTGGTNAMIGVSKLDTRQGDSYAGHDGNSWSYYSSNGQKYHNGSGTSYGNSWGVDNIIGVAFDTNTRTIWFSKDGVWQNSATISEIAAGTTTNSAYTGIGTAGEFFIPCMSGYDGNKAAFNFGNGYFSTTAVTSAGTNAS
jgi:hypothetical protein